MPEPQPGKRARYLGVLIEAGGHAHGVRERLPEGIDRQSRIGDGELFRVRTVCAHALCNPEGTRGYLVCGLRWESEQCGF